ncbi:MAG: ferredoxin family protein [Desulfobacterales bacterium]
MTTIEDKLFLDRFQVDATSHLRVLNPQVCIRDCREQPCLYFCPAGVYTLGEDGGINVAYEGCLECGSCRIGCPHMNIEWRFPRGGYGVRHKFG